MDNDVALPDRPNWEDRFYFDKQHHVSHERELIVEGKKAAAEVGSLKASGVYRELGANDRRLQQWKSRIAGIIQDASPHRTGLSRGKVGPGQTGEAFARFLPCNCGSLFWSRFELARSGALWYTGSLCPMIEILDGAAEYERIPMATPNTPSNRNRAVVAFLDGRRMKGYLYNFSAQKDHFRLFFEQDNAQRESTEVHLKDLKAIFFARDFSANGEYSESQDVQKQRRKAEVTFRDGEKLVGTTEVYDPQECGFFLIPAAPRSNHLRVFVITKNATQIRWI